MKYLKAIFFLSILISLSRDNNVIMKNSKFSKANAKIMKRSISLTFGKIMKKNNQSKKTTWSD